MRSPVIIGLLLGVACYVSCRQRDPIDPEQTTDKPSSLIVEADGTTTTTTVSTTDVQWPSNQPPPASAPAAEPAKETSKAASSNAPDPANEPVVMGPQEGAARIESLRFAHGNANLCLQMNDKGEATLQNCDGKAKGQKFLFSRSLDGRVQLKDTGSENCLAVGFNGLFSNAVLIGEICESKASQFFSVVDYGNNYSLKYDANNTCLDAEKAGVIPGTRVILFKCSASLNQKIQVVKKNGSGG